MGSESLAVKMITKRDYPDILECDYQIDLEELHELCRAGFGYIGRIEGEFYVYFIYTCKRDKVRIDRLYVNEEHRRKGIGTKILLRLKAKLNSQYKTLEVNIPQENYDATLFLKDAGFKGEILDTDNYLFIYGSK